MYTAQFSEQHVPLAVHYPLTRQVAAHVSDWVLMSKYHRAFFLLMLGAMGASATVDAKLQEAKDATGTGAQDISGKAITQLTKAGSDDNSLAGIELRTEELSVNSGYEYVRFVVTIAVADCTYSATLFGTETRYGPAPTTAYDEVVS